MFWNNIILIIIYNNIINNINVLKYSVDTTFKYLKTITSNVL